MGLVYIRLTRLLHYYIFTLNHGARKGAQSILMKTYLPVKVLLLSVCSFVLYQTIDAQVVLQTGKSYVNITKGLNGGTIEPGDTLEIRATISVENGQITRVHYVDTIPVNTTYIPESLKLLTNEGLVFKSYSDASGDDPAYFDPAGHLRINIGSTYNNNDPSNVDLGGLCTNAGPWTLPNGGKIVSNQGRPTFYGSTCIISASYRIRVNTGLAYGTMIALHGGSFYYRNAGSNTDKACNAYTVALQQNLGLCPNSIGANAVIENGGTFGSGNTQNRSTSAIVPGYNFLTVGTGTPNDGNYSIVNNLSPAGATNPALPKPDGSGRRVFTVWDIMGDHTGATNPAAGNNPVAPGDNGGYFVAINASYANSNAIQQTVGGLCPNTYYEFSAWFKNICELCACDSTGQGATSGSFSGPDQSGVNPNLTFTVDDIDYYTTGTMKYTGQWIKKGFIIRTGPSQTTFTITIRNNAAGGGGNDWALDDVTLATCMPNLTMNPSPSFQTCVGQAVDMSALVRCFFPSYTFWRWEMSTDNGVNWTNTGVSGTGSPVLNSGEYEYIAAYPTFLANSSVNNNRYRLRIASTPTNLTDEGCSYAASTLIQLLTAGCDLLASDFKSFTGQLANDLTGLQWTVVNEAPGTIYDIESSEDKVNFSKIGTVTSTTSGTAVYHFTDPKPVGNARYYRIRLNNASTHKNSRIVMVSRDAQPFALQSVINPFKDQITAELTSPEDAQVIVKLLDAYGREVRHSTVTISKGLNTLTLSKLESLPAGAYILQVQHKDRLLTTKLIKSVR
jgi:hypothetical protein